MILGSFPSINTTFHSERERETTEVRVLGNLEGIGANWCLDMGNDVFTLGFGAMITCDENTARLPSMKLIAVRKWTTCT